jgi:hypothetical protein
MSDQTVNVSILPGELTWSGPTHREDGISAVNFSGIKITDQRGGLTGWTATSLFPNSERVIVHLDLITPGSAPGVNFVGMPSVRIEKDQQLGPAGSTGGQYEFTISVILPLGVDGSTYEFPGLILKEEENV